MDQYYVDSSYWDVGYAGYQAQASIGSGLYIEENYFTPNDYYEARQAFASLSCDADVIVIIQASGNLSSEFTQSTQAGKIAEAALSLSVTAEVSAAISHIEGADLFAFSEAAISVEFTRIRATNLTLTSVFDIATDGRRFRDLASAEDAVFDFDLVNERSRAFSIETQAAFSISCDATVIAPAAEVVEASGAWTSNSSLSLEFLLIKSSAVTLSSEFAQSTGLDKTAQAQSDLTSEFAVTALASRTKDIDLTAFTNASLDITVTRQRPGTVSLASEINAEVVANKSVSSTVNQQATSAVSVSSTVSRGLQSQIQTAFTVTGSVIRQRSFAVSANATVSLSATISHIEGADIVVNGFGTLSCDIDDRVRDQSVSMQSQFAQTTVNRRVRFAQSTQSVQAFQINDGISRIRFAGSTISSQTALAADVVKFKGVGATTLSAAFAISATGYEAQKDPAPILTLKNYLLWHFDNAQINPGGPGLGDPGYLDVYRNRNFACSRTSTVNSSSPPLAVYADYYKFGDNAMLSPTIQRGPVETTDVLTATDDFSIDLWHKPTAYEPNPERGPHVILNLYKNDAGPSYTSLYRLSYVYNAGNNTWTLSLFDNNSSVGTYTMAWPGDSGTSQFNPSTGLNENLSINAWYMSVQWYHLVLQRRGTTISVWVNGVQRIAYNPGSKQEIYSTRITLDSRGTYNSGGWVDELRIRPNDTYASTFTPPTSAYGLEYDVYTEKNLYALLEPRFAVSAIGLNVQFGTASISASTAVNAGISRTRQSSAALSVTATRLIVATEVNRTTASLSAETALTASVERARLATGSFSAEFAQNQTLIRIRNVSSSQSMTAAMAIDSDVVGSGRITINSQFQQTAVNRRIRSATPNLESIAVQLSAAVKNATGTITLESRFAATVDVVKQTDTGSTLTSVVNSTVSISKFTGYSIDLDSDFALDTDGQRIQPAGSEMSVAATITANTNNSKTTRFTSSQSVTATLSATVKRSRDTISLQASAGTLTCQNQTLRLAQANINASADLLLSPTFIVRIEAEFTAFNTQLTVGDVLNIDPFLQLRIEPESRTLTIHSESRLLEIEQETRILLIEGWE